MASPDEILRLQVQYCLNEFSTVDDIVRYLRETNPQYRHRQMESFTVAVQKAMEPSSSPLPSSQPCMKRKAESQHVDSDRLASIKKSQLLPEALHRSQQQQQGSNPSTDFIRNGNVSNAITGQTLVPYLNPKIIESNAKLQTQLTAKDGLGSGSNKGKETDGPRFRDLGGMQGVLKELMLEVIVPLCHPQIPRMLGVKPISGILLYGPPGCGKTKLAHAIANETGIRFYKISAPEVLGSYYGETEKKIREVFSEAHRNAPSILFIDEVDALSSKREKLQREYECRIVTQLMTCMDEFHRPVKLSSGDSDANSSNVLVIGATNRPDAIDPAFRRPGRFDREIVLHAPDENARADILSVLTRSLKLEGSFDLLKIAKSTPGFVGADLAAVANKAGNLAMERIFYQRQLHLSQTSADQQTNDWWRKPWLPEEMATISITMADFEGAVKVIQPSSRREGFSAIPNVKWEDVGGLDSLREAFNRYIIWHIKCPEKYEEFGMNMETGFMLFGPPGCGKTLIAKAVASEAGANFIHIKGPELLRKHVGESEEAVRTLFSRARTCSPCILFFDEVDSLAKQRGSSEGGSVVERVLNQLLIELDGGDHRRGVYVIGATNRIDAIDKALLRPGRFGKLQYVGLPSEGERALILKAIGRKKPLDADVDLNVIARMEACQNLSGSDLSALMNEAATAALDELDSTSGCSSSDGRTIKQRHFVQALSKISPSVSKTDIQIYERLAKHLKAL